jgi:CheY-like chemotaxis protein
MMERNVLLVDDQRDILRLLHATLDTLNIKKLKVFESLSGEEALLLSTRYKIDLLVTDYMLPGMSGVDLMHKIRARHPEANVIFITGVTDRKMREEILNAGAQAIFDKPIPMTDFLDVVERSLGLVRTIFPSEVKDEIVEGRHARLSDLLANFRQDIKAEAVFLLNDHGLVQARTGKLLDASMEVSLISTLMAIHASSLKVARHNHQDSIDSFHVFSGGDHDLLFIPVTPMYALLVAGNGLAAEQRVLETISALLALRTQVERALKSMGVTGELQLLSSKPASAPVEDPAQTAQNPLEESPSTEMETLLVNASLEKTKANDTDDFWNQAAEKLGNRPINSTVISQEDARKLGLIPDGN